MHAHYKAHAPEREISIRSSFNVILMEIIAPIGIKGAENSRAVSISFQFLIFFKPDYNARQMLGCGSRFFNYKRILQILKNAFYRISCKTIELEVQSHNLSSVDACQADYY